MLTNEQRYAAEVLNDKVKSISPSQLWLAYKICEYRNIEERVYE